MRNFLLGSICLGAIIYLVSFSTNDDKKLYENYLEKKSRGETPSGPETLAYWVFKITSLSVPLMVTGVFGLIIYYIF